jgi:hypothetical protein
LVTNWDGKELHVESEGEYPTAQMDWLFKMLKEHSG